MSQLGAQCSTVEALPEDWRLRSLVSAYGEQVHIIGDEVSSLIRAAAVVETDSAPSRHLDADLAAISILPSPFWKRAMDIAGALAGLVIFFPLLLAVAIYIRLVSKGSVFFRQQRYGAGGRPFTMWKFRTIEMDSASQRHMDYVSRLMDSHKRLEKCDRELKIIPGGRLLRRLGVDEVPQLFNVLRGEMSLVGPRPDVMPPESYQPWQRCRFNVVPGITGLWQVSGKNNTTFATMMRMDVLYVRRRSLWLDLNILFQTIPAVLFG